MEKKDNLGSRMKEYEHANRTLLTRRMPLIIRLDGKAFHTFTKGLKKPFDEVLMNAMQETARFLCENIQGCKLAYTQSDEISLLITDYENINTCAWFDKNIEKMVSISASMATLSFNKAFESMAREYVKDLSKEEASVYSNKYMKALFDSRVFLLPKDEVVNYFIWRQQDCVRNSIQMVGQSEFSHKELHKKNCNDIQEMLYQQRNINWGTYPTYKKRGTCIIKKQIEKNGAIRNIWEPDKEIPTFTKNREYIQSLVD